MRSGRVFILESPNPLDLLENRAERLVLEQICKLGGYDAATFLLRDKAELVQTCQYIGGIRDHPNDTVPLFIHLSTHGDAEGVAIGNDNVDWPGLADIVAAMYKDLRHYHGPVVLIVSSCGTDKQELTSGLMKRRKESGQDYVPPEYVVVFATDTVDWQDAVVTWTMFYRLVAEADFAKKDEIQQILTRIYRSGFGHLRYHRWDQTGERYRRFDPKPKPPVA